MYRRIITALTAAAFATMAGAPAAAQDDVVGDWTGVLVLPNGAQLNIGLHVTHEDGALSSTLDSPDQGAMGIPMAETRYADGVLTVKTPAMGLEMELSRDGDALAGVFRQGGLDIDIALARAEPDKEAALRRPQTPEPPFPYAAVSASIANPAAAGVALAGELFVPEGEGPFPGVVLLSGSGGQNRNEELLGHEPFLVLADHLARNGVAVLRYDDRGVAESVGPTDGLTMEGIASDAAAAMAWLKARPEVDAARTGFVGHSEGATTGPMAAQTEDTAFLVLVAGVAVPFKDLLIEQGRLLRAVSGADAAAQEADAAVQAAILEVAATADADSCPAEATARLTAAGITAEMAEAHAGQACSAWMRHALQTDLTAPLAAFGGPVLALFGSKDLQVPPHQNAEPMRALIDQGGDPTSRVVVLDGLNHLMQPADTGAVAEYGQIETTFDPAALDAIAAFVAEVAGR